MIPRAKITCGGRNSRRLLQLSTVAALLAWTAPSLLAQAAAPLTDEEKKKEELAAQEEQIVELSPFEVQSTKDKGYAASSSLAGSRLNTELRDIASAVQVVTSEFAKDIGATNIQKVLVYTTNTEVGGVGGNFYGGNTDDKGRARGMLVDPQKSTRIRGLNDADLTREYFPSDLPMDWYNMSRSDISRGPNAILFGLGSPAGLINNTLKVPNMNKDANSFEFQVGSFGSARQVLDVDQTVIPNQLGIRVVALNDEARFRQDFTYNHDKRLYAAMRWTPRLGKGIFTQFDVQGEKAKIRGNRPVSGTPSDFLSSWFGLANRMVFPTDEYWNAPGFVEPVLYADQTIGGQLWDDHAVSFFSDPNSGAVGLPNSSVQAMLLRGSSNVNGGGWGSWAGMLNPNWSLGNTAHPKNKAAYYANNPTVAAIINDYQQKTGKTFRGFGQGMWPIQMIVDGPLARLLEDQNIIGPNKSEFNNFNDVILGFTQTYWEGRLGINAAYNKQSYDSGYTNLMEGLWGMNMISIDVNQTLRGSLIPNPNFGRPFTIGEGRGGVWEKDRENWRITAFAALKATDFIKKEGWLTRILGEHNLTGVRSSQHNEYFNRFYALYRWDQPYLKAVEDQNTAYATWRGLHYLGDSLLNTPSMNAITGITGVRTSQVPTLTQAVRHDNRSGWTVANFNLLSSENNIDRLYDGASQGYDDTKSKVFVWQGKLLDNVLVPIFGWREDEYFGWSKPAFSTSGGTKDPQYGFVLPYSDKWVYDEAKVKPILAKEQRRSWSLAVHGKELARLFGAELPQGMDITVLYNDSSSFRPSDLAVDVYNKPEALPSGETKDLGVIVSAFNDRVTFRVTKYKTIQHNTVFTGAAPDWGWTKANLGRSMNGMMWEIGGWAGGDPTKRVQQTPEWLVNKWMFGTYDQGIANTPLPANWRDDPNILNQPLRIRAAAVVGSPTYVAQGTMNPDTPNKAYLAPPLTAEEVAYREQWFKARTDAQWSRPVDQEFWTAMGFARNYSDQWGGFWESNAWVRPPNQKSLNDITSEGTEYELTANPTPNWRIMVNASHAEAVRSNVLGSWDRFIEANKAFYADGGYQFGDTPAADYWTTKGYYDIPHTPGDTRRLGVTFNDEVYNKYYQAKATADQMVNELRKWHVNAVTNYSFSEGVLKGVGIGGAVRWQDRSTIGYYPKFNTTANSWVIDLDKPIKGPTETNYDVWISYERRLSKKVRWSIQLNVNDLFAKDSFIPTWANPDGTIAQVRIPSLTSWTVRNTFHF